MSGVKKFISFVVAAIMLVGMLPVGASATVSKTITRDESSGVIAEWNFDGESVTATQASANNTGAVIYRETTVDMPFASGNNGGRALNTSGWNDASAESPKYYGVTINAAGFGSLQVGADLRAAGTGPAHVCVQYSLDGETFTAIGDTLTLAAASWSSMPQVQLPAECDNAETLYVRFAVTDTVSAGGGTVAANGTLRIDNVLIYGVNDGSYEPEPTPVPTQTPIPTEPPEPTPKPVIPDPIDPENPDYAGMLTIEQVLAMTQLGGEITVVGQVTYLYGNFGALNSVLLGDVVDNEVIGLNVFDFNNPEEKYTVGEIVSVKGTVSEYGGVRQLSSISEVNVIDEFEPMAAQEVTVQEINDNIDKYVSEYVVIKDATLGAYASSGSTMITDATCSLPIYRAAAYPDGIAEGDRVDCYGAASRYNATVRLRNGSSDDYVAEPTVEQTANPTPMPTPTPEPNQAAVTFSVGTVEDVMPDTEVFVDIFIDGADYVAHTLTFFVTFNSDALTYKMAVPGSVWNSMPSDVMRYCNSDTAGQVGVGVVCPTDGFSGRGKLLSLKFAVSQNCTQDQPLNITVTNFTNEPPGGPITNIPFNTVDGAINIIPIEHAVTYSVTDISFVGKAIGAKDYYYLDISEASGLFSGSWLVDYPEDIVNIDNYSVTWSGGIQSQVAATWDDEEAWSDKPAFACNPTYEGQTGSVPAGEAGNMYNSIGMYLASSAYMGLQMGGHAVRVRAEYARQPYFSECEHDRNGWYIEIPLAVLESTYTKIGSGGNYTCTPHEKVNSISGKIYVEPMEEPGTTTVTFEVGTVDNVSPGDTVSVPLNITANGPYEAHILAMHVTYDPDMLQITGITPGGVYYSLPNDATRALNYIDHPGDLFIGILCPSSGITAMGRFIGINFKVSGNCTENQPLNITVQEFTYSPLNGDIQNIPYNTVAGAININGAPEPTEPIPSELPSVDLDEALNVPGGTIHFESTGEYPWTVVTEGDRVYAASTNAGGASSESVLTAVVDVEANKAIAFDFKAWGEGSATPWDKCIFAIDGGPRFTYGALANDWTAFECNVPAGTHTLTWIYSKDNSNDPNGDYFAIDNVEIKEREGVPVNAELDEALNVPGGEIRFTSTGTYPWIVVEEGDRVYAMSGNQGVNSSTSELTATVVAEAGEIVQFDFMAWGEGTGTFWDHCDFYVDGARVLYCGAYDNQWETFIYVLTAGEHELKWSFTKDGSNDGIGDFFKVDNVCVGDVHVTVTYTGAYTGTETVEYGGDAVLPVLDAEGLHYTFTVDGEPWDGTNITEDVTVEVGMAIDEYTVIFYDPVGEAAISTQLVTYGMPAEAPDGAPEHYGYTFAGWDGDYGCIMCDTVIYAVYEPVLFSVIFTDGFECVISEQTVPYHSCAIPPELPDYDGWTFTGWDADFSCIEHDMIINATWSRNYYTVTFTGVYSGTVVVEHGHDCELPVYPSPAISYVFTVDGEPWDGTNITGDVTVTVTAAVTRLTVRFCDWDGTLLKEQVVNYNAAATAPEVPEREGYTFVGWDKSFDHVTCDMDITAVYAPVNPTGVPGDVNCDGVFSFNDISALSLFLIGIGELAEGVNADFNGDGQVNFKDLADMYIALLN